MPYGGIGPVNPDVVAVGASLTSNTAGLATSAKQDTLQASVGPVVATDIGQNLALADTNSHAFASAVAVKGVWVCALSSNTVSIFIGFATGVTTSTGFEIKPGEREFFPVSNASNIFAITGTATQNARALVC
jgi:hypothetical protein